MDGTIVYEERKADIEWIGLIGEACNLVRDVFLLSIFVFVCVFVFV